MSVDRIQTAMRTRQQKYELTEKGKVARKKAVATYKAKLVKWEAMLSPEMSDALEAQKPEEMSKQAFIKKIFQDYLDSVCNQDTY